MLSCNVSDPDPYVYRDRTKRPEEDTRLLAVIAETDTLPVSDTVKLVYVPGATKPTFSTGDVLFGAMGGGYMKRVVSISERGDTLVALTEQATLLDVFLRLQVDTTFPIAPTQLTLPESRVLTGNYDTDGEYQFHLTFGVPRLSNPDNRTAVVTVPDFLFEVSDEEEEVVISVGIREVVLTLRTDAKGYIDIEEGPLGLPVYHGFDIEFSMHDTLEFRDLEVMMAVDLTKEHELPLCQVSAPFALGPVPMTFQVDIDAGVFLSVAAEASLEAQVKAGFDLELSASHRVGMLVPDGSIKVSFGGEAELTDLNGTFSAEIKPFVTAEASVRLAGVLGPYLAIEPYQYNRLSAPPPTLDLGVGVSAEFGVLLDAFGLFEIRGGWEFLDKNVGLYYTRRIFAENFDFCNLGPGIEGGSTTWVCSIAPKSWLGVTTDGYLGSRCVLVHDTTFDANRNPPDWDSSYASAFADIGEGYREVYLLFKPAEQDCDVGVRARGNPDDSLTESWHIAIYAGNLCYYDGSANHVVAPVTPGKWHSLRVKLSPVEGSYNIYLDGTRVKQSAPFRGTNPGYRYLEAVEYPYSHYSTPGLRIDDISLWSNTPGRMALPAPGPVQPEGSLHRGGRRFGR
jgi:hypothetical protein